MNDPFRVDADVLLLVLFFNNANVALSVGDCIGVPFTILNIY